jgi:hypothetical protein
MEGVIANHASGHPCDIIGSTKGQAFLGPALLSSLGECAASLGHPRADGVDADAVSVRRVEVGVEGAHEILDTVFGDLVDRHDGGLPDTCGAGEKKDRAVHAWAPVVAKVDAGHASDVKRPEEIHVDVLD